MGYIADKIIEKRQENERKEIDHARKDIDRMKRERDRYVSIWSSIRETWWRFGLGAFLLYISYLLVGVAFTAAMTLIMSLVIFLYTDKIHRVPGEKILEIRIYKKSLLFHEYRIPPALFNMVVMENYQPAARTSIGSIHLAEMVEFDERGVVSAIRFMHPEHNLLKFIMDAEEYGNLIQIAINDEHLITKYEKLMPLLTKLAARKITKEQFEALGSAYSEDEDQAPKVIKKSLEEIRDLKDTNDLIRVRSSP
jgi:hypothetical protein